MDNKTKIRTPHSSKVKCLNEPPKRVLNKRKLNRCISRHQSSSIQHILAPKVLHCAVAKRCKTLCRISTKPIWKSPKLVKTRLLETIISPIMAEVVTIASTQLISVKESFPSQLAYPKIIWWATFCLRKIRTSYVIQASSLRLLRKESLRNL